MDLGQVALYAPARRSVGRWPNFVGDAGPALMAAGVHFAVDRTIPPPSRVNNVYNGYVSSHFGEFSATGELEFAEGLASVLLGLASLGRLDKRVHPTSGALLALRAGRDDVRPGGHTLHFAELFLAEKLENFLNHAEAEAGLLA